MADMQRLRELLKQRMATMADEIMDLFQTTIREFVEERSSPSPDSGEEALFPPHMARSPQQYTEIPEQPSMVKLEKQGVYSREEEPVQTPPNTKMCVSDIVAVSAEETHANTPCTTNGNQALLPCIKEEEEEVRCTPGEELFTPEALQLSVCNPVTLGNWTGQLQAPSDCTGRTETPSDFTVKSEAPSDWPGIPVAPSDWPGIPVAPSDCTGTPVTPNDFTVKSEAPSDWTGTPVAPTDLNVKSELPSEFIVKPEAPSECNGQLEVLQQSPTKEQTPDVQQELVVTTLHERKETPPPPLLRREDLQSSSADNGNEEANSPPALQFESDATLDSSNSDMEDSEDDVKYKFCKIPSKIRRKVPGGQKTQSMAAKRSDRSPNVTSNSSGSDDNKAKRPCKRRRTLKKSQKPEGKQKARLSKSEKRCNNVDVLEKHKRSHFPT
ncbi:acidic repeat-containing protein-like [Gouania willdenowi]|uniref:acidic repeat-containing protein-like n=1 Tax=Gouania willdenowi TaxID=441366 RepID=UPI0010560AAB|nr:acidic repeat-containing protein-like [Gouania willdenowi]